MTLEHAIASARKASTRQHSAIVVYRSHSLHNIRRALLIGGDTYYWDNILPIGMEYVATICPTI